MMLRQVARGLCRQGLAARSVSTTVIARTEADDETKKQFLEKFDSVTPSTMAKPNFPSDFLKKEDKEPLEAPSSVPEKLTFNFYLPHEQIAKNKKVLIQRKQLQSHNVTWRRWQIVSPGLEFGC